MSKGNIYGWIDKTWNPIRGECPHKCHYCYVPHSRVKHLYGGKPHLIESVFKPLGKGKTIFVGSMFDICAEEIPSEWIIRILEHCRKYDNTYLFQSKNPKRFQECLNLMPDKVCVGTTIETNRHTHNENAPCIDDRISGLYHTQTHPQFVSIEPIMDFDLSIFVDDILRLKPNFVSIGADSKGHNLPEPSWDKVEALITELKKFIEVWQKDNLKRLLK